MRPILLIVGFWLTGIFIFLAWPLDISGSGWADLLCFIRVIWLMFSIPFGLMTLVILIDLVIPPEFPDDVSSSDNYSGYSIPGDQVFDREGRTVGRVWAGREFYSTSGGVRSGTTVYDWRGRSVGRVDGNRVRR